MDCLVFGISFSISNEMMAHHLRKMTLNQCCGRHWKRGRKINRNRSKNKTIKLFCAWITSHTHTARHGRVHQHTHTPYIYLSIYLSIVASVICVIYSRSTCNVLPVFSFFFSWQIHQYAAVLYELCILTHWYANMVWNSREWKKKSKRKRMVSIEIGKSYSVIDVIIRAKILTEYTNNN